MICKNRSNFDRLGIAGIGANFILDVSEIMKAEGIKTTVKIDTVESTL